MNLIKFSGRIEFESTIPGEKNKEVKLLVSDGDKRVMEIKLRAGETLLKHTTPGSISVLCVVGKGTFKAGNNLEEEIELTAGSFVYLEKMIPHEVYASNNLKLVVTKFSD